MQASEAPERLHMVSFDGSYWPHVSGLDIRHALPASLLLPPLNRRLPHLVILPIMQRRSLDPINPLPEGFMILAFGMQEALLDGDVNGIEREPV